MKINTCIITILKIKIEDRASFVFKFKGHQYIDNTTQSSPNKYEL